MNTKNLIDQIKKKKSFLCIGLDVDLTKIPQQLLKEEDPIFAFNKAIAKMYELTGQIGRSNAAIADRSIAIQTLAQLMAPITPHLAEEIWAKTGGKGLIAQIAWPKADPAELVDDTITLPIQVNGKRRAEIQVAADADKADIEAMALNHPSILPYLDGKPPKKLIIVPGRIINVVV